MQAGSDWVAVIIEDDPDVRDLIDIVLTQSGFRTVVTENGPDGVEAVRQHNPLLTTLDVNMPGMDGFAAAKRLREFSNTYLIMITALADEIDVVQGFEAGADDYLVKPFRPRELRARADSMLRRPRTRYDTPAGWADDDGQAVEHHPHQESWAAAAARDLAANHPLQPIHLEPIPPAQQPAPPLAPQPQQPAPQPYQPAPPVEPVYQQPQHYPPATYQQPPQQQPVPLQQAPAYPQHAADAAGAPHADGGWVRLNGLALNNETRVVTVNGAAVDLTRTEFDLLASLLSTGRRVRSKADLVLTMRGQQYVTSYFVNEADKRSVEVHIANLRRKIGDDAATPRYIETVRGVGYRLAESV
ncbi:MULTISPECIES: response regulator transcription factor [unclassified Nocardioides]|uniref:response regulator transcription factor n=1 Tax=unclassified Nocardioides TaxID=2615069 RepID=UPI0000571619|nr:MULTISPECIES: response regulator transcription factor [unclassified Nocardioides]ABL83000.1 response regulator receiver [Nocardioides sp. JS614]